MVQLLRVGSWADTDNDDGDSVGSHLVGNNPWILSILSWCLGTIGQQHDYLVGIRSGSVCFSEQLALSDTEGFIDTRDGTHKWDLVDGRVEGVPRVEIVEGDAEFRVVGESDDS